MFWEYNILFSLLSILALHFGSHRFTDSLRNAWNKHLLRAPATCQALPYQAVVQEFTNLRREPPRSKCGNDAQCQGARRSFSDPGRLVPTELHQPSAFKCWPLSLSSGTGLRDFTARRGVAVKSALQCRVCVCVCVCARVCVCVCAHTDRKGTPRGHALTGQ